MALTKIPLSLSATPSISDSGTSTAITIDSSGNVTLAANLTISGSTTTISSTSLAITDKKITVANGAGSSSNADESGVEVGVGAIGASSNPSILYTHATTSWDFNKPVNVTGNIGVSGTVDGVDIATRDAILTSTTTTAGAALPKAGGTMTGALIVTDGSTSAPSIGNSGDTNTGIYFPADDQLGLVAAGSRKIHVTASDVTFQNLSGAVIFGNRFKAIDSSSHQLNFGQWDGTNHRIEADSNKPFVITSYHSGGILLGTSGSTKLNVHSTGATVTGTLTATGLLTANGINYGKAFGTGSIMVGDSTTGTINAANNNTGLGVDVFEDLTSGDENTAIGGSAMKEMTTGSYNTAVGYVALKNHTDGDRNVAIGREASRDQTSGSNNTAIGTEALKLNVQGFENVAVGSYCLNNNTGSNNTAVGTETMKMNVGGTQNAAFGKAAMILNTSGNYNTGLGAYALKSNTTNSHNTAVGWSALTLSTGSQNTAVGSSALDTAGGGSNNTAIGYEAMGKTTSGGDNVAVGRAALLDNTTSSGSVAVGVEALENMTGTGNTAVGKQALRGVGSATGSLNVAIGEMAGDSITTGYRNTMLGQRTDVSTGSGAYQIAIGEDCISYGQSRITVGSGAGNNRWWLGFATSTGWAHVSDRRYKENIADNTTLGLAFIKDLRPVTFTWKKKSEIDSSLPDYDPTDNADGHKGPPLDTKVQYGLIAQEVKAVIEAHGVPDFGGWEQEETTGIQAVSGEAFIHPLIKAVQEQQVIIDDLKSRIETLEG